VFRTPAVPLVHAEHIATGHKAFLGQPSYVRGFARAFEAMHKNQRGALDGPRLPMALQQQLRPGFHNQKAILRGR